MVGSTERNSASETDVTFRISRLFDAPRELVFKAWTEREHLLRWWGPKGFAVITADLDLRSGGTFHYQLRSANGVEMWGIWKFREVAPPERLVFVSSFSDPSGSIAKSPFPDPWPLETHSTVTFAEENGGTRVTLEWNPINATEIQRASFLRGHASMQNGWGGTFDQLAAHLASAQRTNESTADREIVTSRLFDAPPEMVYRAWTDPDHVVRWWGPNGFTTTILEMDVRPGGVWRFVMHGPDGVDYPNRIVFSEVIAAKRLVYVHDDDEGGVRSFDVTVTFEEQEGKTLVTLRSVFKTAAERDQVVREYGAIEGAKQTLARLETHLATMERA